MPYDLWPVTCALWPVTCALCPVTWPVTCDLRFVPAGPYNDLENQVRYNPEAGEILEIYDQPTEPTDAVAMQHDVDCSVCGDNRKSKNKADRKMVKSLDAIPYN